MGAAFDHSAYCQFVELQIRGDTATISRIIPFRASMVCAVHQLQTSKMKRTRCVSVLDDGTIRDLSHPRDPICE